MAEKIGEERGSCWLVEIENDQDMYVELLISPAVAIPRLCGSVFWFLFAVIDKDDNQ